MDYYLAEIQYVKGVYECHNLFIVIISEAAFYAEFDAIDLLEDVVQHLDGAGGVCHETAATGFVGDTRERTSHIEVKLRISH